MPKTVLNYPDAAAGSLCGDRLTYSIVIPVHNESQTVYLLCKALQKAMSGVGGSYEIIFVNNGPERLEPGWLGRETGAGVARVINIPRKIGQTRALFTGFKYAKGDFFISLDGDMQDNPDYLPFFIAKLSEGLDVVCGNRVERKERLLKLAQSKAANFIQRKVLGTVIHDAGCNYRIFRRECIMEIRHFRDYYHLYLPFILGRKGYRVGEIFIRQEPRFFGNSKYNFLDSLKTVGSFFMLGFDLLAGNL